MVEKMGFEANIPQSDESLMHGASGRYFTYWMTLIKKN
jgi:hypothetical protein